MKRSFGKNEATHFREEQKFWGVNQNGYQFHVTRLIQMDHYLSVEPFSSPGENHMLLEFRNKITNHLRMKQSFP